MKSCGIHKVPSDGCSRPITIKDCFSTITCICNTDLCNTDVSAVRGAHGLLPGLEQRSEGKTKETADHEDEEFCQLLNSGVGTSSTAVSTMVDTWLLTVIFILYFFNLI